MNFISGALREVLYFIDGVVGSYGWSVVLFTFLIRLVLFPLDVKSKQSMRSMNVLKPQLDAIQKKYANDKEKLTKKQQELYRKAGVSPLSGCLPMLIQLPIMFCMFTAMRVVANERTIGLIMKMIEISKQEGFEGAVITEQFLRDNGIVMQSWLWVKNVFQPDTFWSTVIPAVGDKLSAINAVAGIEMLSPEKLEAARAFLASEAYLPFAEYFGATKVVFSAPMVFTTLRIPEIFNGYLILPVLAGSSQILSSKLLSANQPQDEASQQSGKMMNNIFPIISVWFCCTSTTAFAIYWVAANIIQIISQLAVNWYFARKDAMASATTDNQEVIKP